MRGQIHVYASFGLLFCRNIGDRDMKVSVASLVLFAAKYVDEYGLSVVLNIPEGDINVFDERFIRRDCHSAPR